MWFCKQLSLWGRKGEGKPGKRWHINTFLRIFVDNPENMRIINVCMDTKNDTMTVKCGNMAVIPREKLVVGAKQFRKALRTDSVSAVYLAKNADPAMTEPIQAQCKESGIPCTWVKTMHELGQACGIEVGAAAATVLK